MRSRTLVLLVVFAAASLALPLIASAHAIPYFGPIIEERWNICPLGWNAVILVVNNIIVIALTLIITFLAPIMIAYSGFLYVVNPVNPAAKAKAKSILTNTIVGLVIALAAWLIVDAVMVALLGQGKGVAFWTSMITSSGDPCLEQSGSGARSVSSGTPSALNVAPRPASVAPTGPSMSQSAITRAARAVASYRAQVCAAAAAQDVSSQCDQLLAIIGVESGGDPNARGPNSEIGLMQLQPATAANNGVTACRGSSNANPSAACVAALTNPTTSINAGVTEYARLYNKFSGNQANATAAYNAGDGSSINPSGTKQAFYPSADCPGMLAWQCPINPGGFLVTQRYVANVNAVAAAVATP